MSGASNHRARRSEVSANDQAEQIEIGCVPPPETEWLHAFCDANEALSEESAQRVKDEAEAKWSQLKGLKTAHLQRLNVGLMTLGMTLDYHLLGPFLAGGCLKLENNHYETEEDVARMVQHVTALAGCMYPLQESPPPLVAHEETALLPSIVMKLKEIREANVSFEDRLQNLCGDTALDFSEGATEIPFACLDRLAATPDTTSVRLYLAHAVKFYYRAFKNKQRGLNAMLSDVFEILEGYLKASTSDAA